MFDVTFNYVSRRLADSAIAGDVHGRDVEAFDISQAAGKFDITLNVLEDERAIGPRRAIARRFLIGRRSRR